MGLMDDLGGKAKDLADQNPDKLKEGVEKAGDFVDEKTGGKYADKVDQAQQAAEDRLGGGQAPTDQQQ